MANAPNTRWTSCLVRDFQFGTAVNDIGFQSIQRFELAVTEAIPKVFLLQCPREYHP